MAKHKYIETPEKMWELFEQYRAKTKSNPRKKMVFVGKDGNKDYELLETPLTIEGFRNYARQNVGCVNDYFANTDERYTEYATICRAIVDEIREDQITGGMVGQYNPSITQRLNGLVDKKETEIKGVPPIFPDID
jgi:3-deoxy-D-arabino-heptulosonate 7-phosphate (DAHP) synthase